MARYTATIRNIVALSHSGLYYPSKNNFISTGAWHIVRRLLVTDAAQRSDGQAFGPHEYCATISWAAGDGQTD
jgi:hypothetical protein